MKYNWKLYITWFIALIFLGLIINFLTIPFIKKILSAQTDIENSKVEFSMKKNYKDELTQISKSSDFEKYTKKWSLILPNNSDQSDFFSVMLEDLASKDNLTVTSIAFDKTEKKPTGISLPAEIEAISYTFIGKGNYDSVIQFIKDTSKVNRINHFQHINIKPDENQFTLNLQGEIYKIKGTPKTDTLVNFDFFNRLKEWTDLLVDFSPPTANEVPIGKDNPFQ